MNKSIWFFCLAILFFSNLYGCAYYAKGPWKGRVLDAETKEPIEGAAVIIYWDETYLNVVERNSTFLYAKEYLTDADGRFDIPSQSIPSKKSMGTISGPNWFIYKNGFDFNQGASLKAEADRPSYHNEATVLLNKLKNREARIYMVDKVLPFLFLPSTDRSVYPETMRLINSERIDLGLMPIRGNK